MAISMSDAYKSPTKSTNQLKDFITTIQNGGQERGKWLDFSLGIKLEGKGDSLKTKVHITFSLNFSYCFPQYSDRKFAMKKMGHHAPLGDITGSSYSLNPCNCIYQAHVYSISSRNVAQEQEAQL